MVVLPQLAFRSFAVTDKEMDHARALAAQAYLRYANDGSGYLDDIKVSSMKQLESRLKSKEKENLKAFKSVKTPGDYASWDKSKLVEYWSVTFFKSSGLSEKGRAGKFRARKNIQKMQVAAPVVKEEKSVAEPNKKEDKQKEVTASEAEASEAAATPVPEAAESVAPAPSGASATVAAVTDSASDELENKEDSHTWIYVVVLVVLVLVVVWLVSFASKVMRRGGDSDEEPAVYRKDTEVPSASESASAIEMREKFAATLNQKNADISSLNAKNESLIKENASLKSDMDALVAETGSLRTRLTEALKKIGELEAAVVAAQAKETRMAYAPQPENVAVPAPEAQPFQTPVQAASAPVAPAPVSAPVASAAPSALAEGVARPRPVRVIYLGRVNARDIFVRADRQLNIGNSIFVLETTDGYSGSFRVVDNPTVWNVAMLSPAENLERGCVGPDLGNTDNFTRIVNDSSGTAIFENGCWRVIRKAKIHYE